MKFKLDENLPVSSAAILASAGHDVDTVPAEGLTGAPDQGVVTAATAAGRVLISLDLGLGDIRAYPPGSHSGLVILRLADQSAATVTKAISDLASVTELDSLTGAIAAAIGVSVARVSRIGHGEVTLFEVVARYVEALGGRLDMTADFSDRTIDCLSATPSPPHADNQVTSTFAAGS